LNRRVLIVDDEAQIRKFLRISLEANGFEAIEAETAQRAIQLAATQNPALVILDLGLPDLDGKNVVARLREWSGVPILILSVRSAENEKVAALDAGANDYVVKPFGIQELLARIRSLLRSGPPGEAPESHILQAGGLTIDFAAHTVALDGEPVKLTRKEFDLLHMLARHPGKLVTQKMLLAEIWGPAHEADTQYLRVYIGQLRAKLKDDAANPRFIETEPGIGYRFMHRD